MIAGRRPPWLGIAFLLLLSGCTGLPVSSPATGGSVVVPSIAPTVAITIVPTPASDPFAILPATPPADFDGGVTCSGTIDPGDPVAIVQLKGIGDESGATVLQDFADPSTPRTVCTFKGGMDLLDGRHAIMGSDDVAGLYAVIDLPEVRYRWLQLPRQPETSYPSELVAIPPALDRVAWISRDPEVTASDAIHLTTATTDLVVSQVPNTNTGRCGDANDSRPGAYTQSGALLYVLNRPDPSNASLLVIDGEVVRYSLLAPKDGWAAGDGPAMAVWSPTLDTLYFRNGDDVWRWTADAGAMKFLPGVRWFFPTISPDGTYLAYSVLRPDGLPDVYLVDLANGADTMLLGTGRRNLPAFLSNTQLWYVGTEDVPGCEGASKRTPLVYSLEDGSETPSTIESVFATWPATSSNH